MKEHMLYLYIFKILPQPFWLKSFLRPSHPAHRVLPNGIISCGSRLSGQQFPGSPTAMRRRHCVRTSCAPICPEAETTEHDKIRSLSQCSPSLASSMWTDAKLKRVSLHKPGEPKTVWRIAELEKKALGRKKLMKLQKRSQINSLRHLNL